ncbi:Hypothetical_protein [Hexamita inflata]|uniref:Hypothetical_protein n=1 Tax=Hexamita inflata TaxID=28002 RepID=A0AA86PP35_9EUKA|nr:Hypothetical protein HINF_LOCUS31219 [Hexamita inflata]
MRPNSFDQVSYFSRHQKGQQSKLQDSENYYVRSANPLRLYIVIVRLYQQTVLLLHLINMSCQVQLKYDHYYVFLAYEIQVTNQCCEAIIQFNCSSLIQNSSESIFEKYYFQYFDICWLLKQINQVKTWRGAIYYFSKYLQKNLDCRSRYFNFYYCIQSRFFHEYTIEIMKHSKLKSPFNVSHKKLSQHASDVQVSIKLKLCADKKLKIIKRLLQSIFSKQILQFILK